MTLFQCLQRTHSDALGKMWKKKSQSEAAFTVK